MRCARPFIVGLLSTAMLSMASALARADEGSIVLDLVRHGETLSNLNGIIDTAPPGAPLDAAGIAQANAVADSIYGVLKDNISGLFASDALRTQQTAEPLAELLSSLNNGNPFPVEALSGLNEIPAGVFEGQPTASLAGILYLLGPISWTLGFPLVPNFGDPSMNGITFDEGFGLAVQHIYDGTVGTGDLTTNDVAFSSAGAIAVWTLMNVKNPDFSILFNEIVNDQEFLPNTGQVVIEGSPGDWTLVSYDGVAVPADPGLATQLFVDFRDLLEAPQFAAYDIYEALLTGNATTIDAALQAGFTQIDNAFTQFPIEVFDHLVAAFGGGI
ncbi:histidine phosphatase family protein [Candidatus Mycobacterium wuenschmannii]|uniref:Histidine phosphatase family protein n=1 Tax=Candidatus Mycobacterium wuenschmannii TaxID=3027808 RepID=A0ABY8VSJ5_9MYCO|nr:histidine phosphatase family protein [Candidatus Mycobacterium wuenschmannii]WIM86296.1 histidine phosphatase family protein [Candidatus Mycobacterium wuenschmannii]